MANFAGKYQWESSENFDEFLKALGVNFFVRSLAKSSKPTIEITLDDDRYTIKTISSMRTTVVSFKLGEEFEETRGDGKVVKTVMLKEGEDKLVQTLPGEKEVKVVREFSETHLKTICTVGQVTSTRVFKRV